MPTKIRTRQCLVPTEIKHKCMIKYAQDRLNIARNLSWFCFQTRSLIKELKSLSFPVFYL